MLAWIAYLPLTWVHFAGAAVGWLAYALSPDYRRRVQENAALAGVAAADVRRAVAEAGRMSAEVPWLWFRPESRPLGKLVRWDSSPVVAAAVAAGRPLLFLTPHLGSFEVSARAYAERFGAQQPITVLYRPAKKAWLADIQATARQRPGMDVAPATLAGVRLMLRALKRGHSVGLLPDQVPPEGQGVWAPFFGRPAYTMTLAARLAQQTGAVLAVVWCERLPRGAGFVFHERPLGVSLPSLKDAGEAFDLQAASAINQAMEGLIREAPGQYLWGYNRYKPPRAAAPPTAPAPAAPPKVDA
ncbi:Lauroyl/myristoyl acyltransferase [Burkholderiales bacterium JOSHI_001]|nr:Lauroyl/myristoyl acyltransferase [Burkholderiales bacterium JOSHI_001]